MARYTTTPWRHQRDLLSVRQHLYNTSDPDAQRHAVSRVMAWKLRSNLPHAVESTALLVDAILHHDLTHNSIFSIRAVYSAAFTRFVTGFCDIGRNRERSLEPSSMLEIAKQIGMPVEFVALRHEATHEELPSVQRLVAVCGQALEWLWRVYWERLEEPVVATAEIGEVETQLVKDEVRRVFKEFRSARKQGLKARNAAAQNQDLVHSTATAVAGLCAKREDAHAAASDVLIDEKMLYPTDREMGAPLDGAYLLWDDLLLAISSQQSAFLQTLMDHMLRALTRQSNARPGFDAGKEALSQWLSHLATSPPWRRRCQNLHFHAASRMINHCCLVPSLWSYQLGEALLKTSDSQDFIDAWSELLAASAIRARDHMDDDDGEDMAEKSTMSSRVTLGDQDTNSVDAMLVVDDGITGGWREALFTPRAPIGVVR